MTKSQPDDGVVVRAADSISESADDEASKSKLKDTLVLGSLFGLWYLFNIYFNIYNKQVAFRISDTCIFMFYLIDYSFVVFLIVSFV